MQYFNARRFKNATSLQKKQWSDLVIGILIGRHPYVWRDVYTLNGNNLQPLAEIELAHPERNEKTAFDVEKDDWFLYPSFNRLHGGGEYFLLEFNTTFPRGIYDSFRSKGENFHMDPDYQKAREKYVQTKYILTDTQGNQAAISELPVPGVVHLLDADDVLYIKPNSDTELDYNVFYRYQLSLE